MHLTYSPNTCTPGSRSSGNGGGAPQVPPLIHNKDVEANNNGLSKLVLGCSVTSRGTLFQFLKITFSTFIEGCQLCKLKRKS